MDGCEPLDTMDTPLDGISDRIEAVNTLAGNLSPSVDVVDVTDTHIVAEGRPAGAVDSIFVGFQANQLPPVLPADTGSTSSSSN